MHMAHPASNELMMNYVGKKKSGINQCFKFQSLERFLVFECQNFPMAEVIKLSLL